MKKLLLFVMAVMAFAGMSVAQTVYTAGMYTNASGNDAAIVFCNGEIIQDISSGDLNYRCRDVVLDSQRNLFTVENQSSTTTKWGDVRRNDDLFLDNVSGTEIYALAVDVNDNLYSVGTKTVGSGVDIAAIWKNDDSAPYAQHGDGINRCVATGVVCEGIDVYTCGYEEWIESGSPMYNGFVWKNNETEPFLTISGVRFNDIDVYEGKIYTIGEQRVGNNFVAKVFKNGEEIHSVSLNGHSINGNRVKVDCGDVYYTTSSGNDEYTIHNSIWKNEEEYNNPENAVYLYGLDVTPEGVFYAVTTGEFFAGYHAAVYKDRELLWAPEKLEWVDHVFVAPACNNEVRTLPYFEGFEMGETDWACWETRDVDGLNEGFASYWHRVGKNNPYNPQGVDPATGNYCAMHGDGPQGVDQVGLLVSPQISIPEGGAVKLTFKHYECYASNCEYEGVWIASDSHPDLEEVWRADDDEVWDAWTEKEIDLSNYKGENIQIAFKYKGDWAHIWYIDDVSIVQEYLITTEVNPADAGTVEGGGSYPDGAQAFLTASPNQGWHFSHWNDGITSNPREITVTGNATYTANFLQDNYTITVMANPTIGGTVSGGGNNYHYGDMANLTATPASGYVFNSWSDGNTESNRTVAVTGDAVYVANFSVAGATTYTVTVTSNNELLGSVSGSGTYPAGSTVQIQAMPSQNAYFVKWDDGNTENPRNIEVTQNMNFVAEFAAYQTYTITVQSANPSMGSATGGGTFQEGTVIQISATANSGYYFIGWDDGNADNPRSITVTQNATYKAQFSTTIVQTYSLTVMCNTSEGSVIGTGTYAAGSNVTIAAIPNAGFEFDKWNDGSTHNPRQVTVNDNMTFVAFFKGTGIDESGETRYAVYPNPANDNIRLEGIEADSEVRIYNATGALVKVTTVSANEEINIGELSAGLYMVRCGNATLRFLKK